MIVEVNAQRQVTVPSHALNAIGAGPGDKPELIETPAGYLLHPRCIDYSRPGTLWEKIPRDHPIFVMEVQGTAL